MKLPGIPVLLLLCLIPGVLGSLSDGLVLNYTMHSDTNPVCVDYSPESNNGTVTGATWDSFGVTDGGAMSFDGDGDYISVNNELNMTGWHTSTISAWVKFPDYTAQDMVVTILHSNSDDIRLLLETSTLKIIYDDGTVDSASAPMSDAYENKWIYVTGVHYGTNCSIFINSIRISTDPICTFNYATANGTTNIGRRYNTPDFNWNGSIDEVKIWNRSLNASEILAIYNTEKVTHINSVEVTGDAYNNTHTNWSLSISQPVTETAYWNSSWYTTDQKQSFLVMPMNTPAATDISGYGNNGTITGATWCGDCGYGGNGAYVFDGNDLISLPDNLIKNTSVTIDFWFEQDIVSAPDKSMFTYRIDDSHRLIIYLNDGLEIKALMQPSGYFTNYTVPLVTGTWQHLTWTYEKNGNQTLYIDGVKVDTELGDTFYDSGYVTRTLGYGPGYFIGKMDNVIISNYSWSAEQVMENHQAGLNSRPPNLVPSETTTGDTWTAHTVQSNSVTYSTELTADFYINGMTLTHTPVTAVTFNPLTLGYSVDQNADCQVYLNSALIDTQSNMTYNTTYTTSYNLTIPTNTYEINCTDITDGSTATTGIITLYYTNTLPVHYNTSICNLTFVPGSEHWVLQQFACENYLNSITSIYDEMGLIAVVMSQIFLIIFLMFVGIANTYQYRNYDTTKITFWLAFTCFALALVELILTIGVVYVKEASGDISNILWINLMGVGFTSFIVSMYALLRIMFSTIDLTGSHDKIKEW